MPTENWEKILKLLCIVIMADGRVYKEEVDTFVKAAVDLNAVINPSLFITEKMALDWFVSHRDEIKALIMSPAVKPKIETLIRDLIRVPQRKDILRMMYKIAKADDDFHRTEEHIIARAAKIWNVPLPR